MTVSKPCENHESTTAYRVYESSDTESKECQKEVHCKKTYTSCIWIYVNAYYG